MEEWHNGTTAQRRNGTISTIGKREKDVLCIKDDR